MDGSEESGGGDPPIKTLGPPRDIYRVSQVSDKMGNGRNGLFQNLLLFEFL